MSDYNGYDLIIFKNAESLIAVGGETAIRGNGFTATRVADHPRNSDLPFAPGQELLFPSGEIALFAPRIARDGIERALFVREEGA